MTTLDAIETLSEDDRELLNAFLLATDRLQDDTDILELLEIAKARLFDCFANDSEMAWHIVHRRGDLEIIPDDIRDVINWDALGETMAEQFDHCNGYYFIKD